MINNSVKALRIWFWFHVACAIVTNRTDDFVDFILTQPHAGNVYNAESNKCTNRLHTSLEKLRRRQANLKSTGFIDLSGYALHQTLRHAPLDMYVTNIRVKTPGVGDWVRIQKCQFSNRDNRMTTQILFNDLTVSGTVQLLDDTEILKNSFHPTPREFCKMSLRLQRAGLGINAFPTRGRSRGIEVRTEARFMEPKFLSVHAYGCKLNDIFKRTEETLEGRSSEGNHNYVQSKNQDQSKYLLNQTTDFLNVRQKSVREAMASSQENDPEVRIITLNPDIRTNDDSSKWFSLHRESEGNMNDFHRQRIQSTRLQTLTERDRVKAILHIKNLIAQQANHMFQAQGPFSQQQKPYFRPNKPTFSNSRPVHSVVSSITELDENLSPIRPVSQRPFEALFSASEPMDHKPNHSEFSNYFEEVSREMEDIFLRGIKTLLTRYVEKQLEIPLKEALMPYKHTKIDTADLSDCALQGEWKPMGVAHSHLHVSGDNSQQVEILQSVGSYAVPNKLIPHWQQSLGGQNQNLQNGLYNHKPFGLYAGGTGGYAYSSNYGYGAGSGSGFIEGGTNAGNNGLHSSSYQGSAGGFSGTSLGQFQKVKSSPILSRPPVPPIVFGKKPGYWKVPKTKHKFFPGKGRRPGFSAGGSYAFSSQMNHGGGGHSGTILSSYLGHGGIKHGGGGGISISGSSGHMGHNSGTGGFSISGNLGIGGHGIKDGTSGLVSSGHSGHGYGSGVRGSNNDYGGGVESSSSGGSNHGFGSEGVSISEVINHGYGGGIEGSFSTSGSSSGLSLTGGQGVGGGAVAGHLIADSEILPGNSGLGSGAKIEGELSSGGHVLNGALGYKSHGGGSGVAESHVISPSALGSGQTVLLVHNSASDISAGHLVGTNHGADNSPPEAAFLSTELNKPSGGGSHYQDSTFSSSQISQGPGKGNSFPDASFLSSHINQDFAVHAKGVSDDLSSSTFTCGKNHDHNTNYHTATFQVADHDHPSSVDVLQYGGDAAVLIQSGDTPFHDQILPERKHYKTSHLSDAEVSGSDNRNELVGQAAQLTSQSTKQESEQSETDPVKLDDGEEPERHSYYHEIKKVTKIPANSVGTVEYTFSKYETKPQTFSTESDTPQEEPEVEQPQIIRELEHLSNKFQLDLENPQKLFDDPPSQELSYHYPFQDDEHHHEVNEAVGEKEENHEGITEFPYQFYHNPNKVVQVNKKPIIKYIPRPGKPHFHQKIVNYHQPKPPVVVVRKQKPKQFLKKQNYEVHEHSGERHRPIGEIFPPQKFPKQFHNPKPNFAVDRPKNGWRPNVYQEYKYDHSQGKKIKKFKTKTKVLAPILIRRPVSPAPIIRVVEVTG